MTHFVELETSLKGQTQLVGHCKECKEEWRMVVITKKLERLKGGELVEYCFPNLPPSKRELLKSGLCDKCFDSITEI